MCFLKKSQFVSKSLGIDKASIATFVANTNKLADLFRYEVYCRRNSEALFVRSLFAQSVNGALPDATINTQKTISKGSVKDILRIILLRTSRTVSTL